MVALFIVAPARGARAASGSITGVVLTPADVPLAGATVTLQRGKNRFFARTDERGRFAFGFPLPAGVLVARASGFRASSPLVVPAAEAAPIVLRLRRLRSTIGGSVTTTPADDIVPRTTGAAATLSASGLTSAGTQRLGDALARIPGIAAVGQGSSASDDLELSVRGFKPSETLTLLDGHPIGPLGVSPEMTAGFDYQSSPLAALQGATVSYGAGPDGGSAYDAIDGAIDLVTIAPGGARALALAQSTGSQASSSSAIVGTGTSGAVRYALAYGVAGTSGNIAPQTIAQTGLRGTDFTTSTLHALTYPVSANALVRTSLAAVGVPLSRATTVTLTSFTATSWFDKTGVDDNDFYPYAFELYQAKQNLGGALVAGGARCSATTVPVTDDAHPNPAAPDCLTPAAFAAGASGPAGGGPGAFQTLRQADEALRVMTQAGAHNIIADGFADAQTTALVRPASFVETDAETTTTRLATAGFDLTDVVAVGATTIVAGVSSLRQFVTSGDTIVPGGGDPIDVQSNAALGETSAFVSAHGSPLARVDVDASVLVKHFAALDQSAIDPRLSFAYRPTANDAIRVLAGAASAEPAASARSGTPTFSSAGDLDPGNCTAFVVGSAPNAALTSERGSDAELAYGHQFASASLGVTAYVTSVQNSIFDATEPLAHVAGIVADSLELASFYDRIRSVCPGEYAAASDAHLFDSLTVTEAVNAARALARGIELRGELRVRPTFTVKGSYTIDSMRRFDLPAAVLAVPSNATIVDGAQVAGILVHQASMTLAQTNARGLSAELTALYEGPNNNLNLPGYAFANVALHAPIGRALRLDLAVDNVFDSHADTYGRVGLGLFQPENPFGPDTNALEQATERYGLAPTTVRLTISFPRTRR
jgi:hypothetical protein